jgi:hypothetical protein
MFKDIHEINNAFINGKIPKLPINFLVNDINYHYHLSTEFKLEDMLSNPKRAPYVLYTLSKDAKNLEKFNKIGINDADASSKTPKERLMFVWKVMPGLKILPTEVRYETKSRGISLESTNIIVNNINGNKPIKSKIDTTADICSLNAEDIEMEGSDVKFSLNEYNYRMQTCGTIIDSTNNEIPVVHFNIEMSGEVFENVKFAINNIPGDSLIHLGKNISK